MRLGRSSLVISLPKHWTELNELKCGDTVSLAVQSDGSLAIFPGLVRKERIRKITLTIDPTEKEEDIVRKIISCYLNGYSDIKLVSTKIFTVSQQNVIREIVGKLYLRVMEADTRKVLIQSLLDESKVPIKRGIQRMHIIASSMYRDALKALEERNAKLARAVYALDDDVDHFSFLLLRLLRSAVTNTALASQLGLDSIDCLDYQTVIHRIEYIADQAASISKCIIVLDAEREVLPSTLLRCVLAAGYEAYGIYVEAIKAFLSKDLSLANKVLDSLSKVEKLDKEIAMEMAREKRSLAVICTTCSIRDGVKRIAECAGEIAEAIIDQAFKCAR